MNIEEKRSPEHRQWLHIGKWWINFDSSQVNINLENSVTCYGELLRERKNTPYARYSRFLLQEPNLITKSDNPPLTNSLCNMFVLTLQIFSLQIQPPSLLINLHSGIFHTYTHMKEQKS